MSFDPKKHLMIRSVSGAKKIEKKGTSVEERQKE